MDDADDLATLKARVSALMRITSVMAALLRERHPSEFNLLLSHFDGLESAGTDDARRIVREARVLLRDETDPDER